MKIDIPLFDEIGLTMSDGPIDFNKYPTSALQKGLLLFSKGQNLAEEAVGFGVPIIKQGIETLFPGAVDMQYLQNDAVVEISAQYIVNLRESISKKGKSISELGKILFVKNYLSAIMRRVPLFRAPLAALSSLVRTMFSLSTRFYATPVSFQLPVTYLVDKRNATIRISADCSKLDSTAITEVILMNELGAHYFDEYRDSSPCFLQASNIDIWDRVLAQRAQFSSPKQGISFCLENIEGAILYRGRELAGNRLAWAGFGYSFKPTLGRFEYLLRIEKCI